MKKYLIILISFIFINNGNVVSQSYYSDDNFYMGPVTSVSSYLGGYFGSVIR
ncbi:MAG: hypothetical protein IPM38_05655 [Ignavibacteria bacterium]|nr:hypothetical protein [Ignavibacteria bacterium]